MIPVVFAATMDGVGTGVACGIGVRAASFLDCSVVVAFEAAEATALVEVAASKFPARKIAAIRTRSNLESVCGVW